MPPALHRVSRYTQDILFNPEHAWILASLVVLGDAALSQLIIRFVPYTEIDWETYMHHIDLFNSGERNYTSIAGPTGPLVYPAGHVYVYKGLHQLTNSGVNISVAQNIFALLYTTSVAFTCAIYLQAGSIPNYALILLPLSKRLHSIYMLRLFNDCWSVVAMQASMLAFGANRDILGTLLFSLALSVKMSAFLYLPGILVTLWLRRGIAKTALHVLLVIVSQLALGGPFFQQYPREYLVQAFDLSRVFLFKWTVNWRFIGEELFLHSVWAKALLLGHVITLVIFAQTIWCKNDGGLVPVIKRSLRSITKPASTQATATSADYTTNVLMTSNLIGILFARSLHYQFYSWYAQHLPFLAWHTRYPIFVKLLLLLGIEYAWNVFPSTNPSSSILLVGNLALLVGLWYAQNTSKIHLRDGKLD